MVRVLQIIETGAGMEAVRCAAALADRLGAEFVIETLEMGADRTRSLPSTVLHLRGRDERPDVVHAWGTRALTAAALGTRAPIVYTPTSGERCAIDWARAVGSYRRVETVCPTATLRRMHVERGSPLERIHMIRPGIDFARIRGGPRDRALRARLGFDEDDFVMLLPGESTMAAAHADGAWAGAILHMLDPRDKVLAWGRGPLLGAARRTAGSVRHSRVMTVAEHVLGDAVDFEDLLRAADMAAVTARGATATLPIVQCMAAGIPIVSTVTYTTGELLEDRHTALMVPPRQPQQFARRVLDLRADASLQWSITDMARVEAYEYFAQTRMLEQYRAVYRQITAGDPVEVPERAPGAGLRFHGRG